jgi:hypothetical protein
MSIPIHLHFATNYQGPMSIMPKLQFFSFTFFSMEIFEQKKHPKFYKSYIDLGCCKLMWPKSSQSWKSWSPLGKKTKRETLNLKGAKLILQKPTST